ncbi:hypothetical protein LEAN103870_02420 [Legionella anisa]
MVQKKCYYNFNSILIVQYTLPGNSLLNSNNYDFLFYRMNKAHGFEKKK